MKDEKCLIVENKNINKNYFLAKIKAETISLNSRPGNFVMVRVVSEAFEPLLRRAFAILKSKPPFIWLYYEVVGRGTELFSRLKENNSIKILGPLGNSFPEYEKKKILIIAGGRGIAPLLYSAETISKKNKLYLIYGAGSKEDLNLLNEIKSIKFKDINLYTEDGSIGKKGFVTADLKEIMEDCKIDVVFSCGPEEMLKNVCSKLNGSRIETYVSLEAAMGCGFGICYSCVVRAKNNGYKRVCSDGPIFKIGEIDWQTLQ